MTRILADLWRLVGGVVLFVWWIPTVILWTVFAPMLTFFEMLTFVFYPEAKNIDWRFCGMQVKQAPIED